MAIFNRRILQLHHGLLAMVFASLLLLSNPVFAQDEAQTEASEHLYRVELLFFTPREPEDREYLDNVPAPTLPSNGELLYGERLPQGSPDTMPAPAGQVPESPDLTYKPANVDIQIDDFSQTLLPTDDLHLTPARNRLRASGRYDIKFFVAWEEAFPPGHKTPPLIVRAGDTRNGYADIQGFIQIERQRYLHVMAELYDLDLTPEPAIEQTGFEAVLEDVLEGESMDLILLDSQTAPDGINVAGPEVVTWMRETRRMRSGKLHLLDAPTMGLLVYFEPLDPQQL